ncbi:MAG TPA: CsgG/HfaB family protein [Armatimonadota bacterium]|nr:CsgG/HfaB family protein [Armatimonadota bacterium]
MRLPSCIAVLLAAAWLALSALPVCAQDPAAAPKTPVHRRKRIAVIRFEIPNGTLAPWYKHGHVPNDTIQRLNNVLTDMTISALVKTGAFDVVERTELDKVLAEQKLKADGTLDPASAVQAGKVMGADLLLGGKLTEFGVKEKKTGLGGILPAVGLGAGFDLKNSTARVAIDARVIDATTSRILVADTASGENKESSFLLVGGDFDKFIGGIELGAKEWTESRLGRATRDAVDAIVTKILETFPVEASVRGVLPDGGIILDLGRFSGIKVGDVFEVMRETIILDEDTGEEMYRDHRTLGMLTVAEVQDERCKCTPAAPLAEPPKKGDYAVLKKKVDPQATDDRKKDEKKK